MYDSLTIDTKSPKFPPFHVSPKYFVAVIHQRFSHELSLPLTFFPEAAHPPSVAPTVSALPSSQAPIGLGIIAIVKRDCVLGSNRNRVLLLY